MKVTPLDYGELLQEARRQGKKAIDQPRAYFSNGYDPEYRKEQARYVAAHIFPHGPKAPLRKLGPSFYADQIQQGWSKESGLGPFREEKDRYISEGLKLFGETSLGDGTWPFHLTDQANQLGGAICRVLGYLLQQTCADKKEQRQMATRRLEKIIRNTKPETRGKRKRVIRPEAVKFFYFGELFQLYQIQNALRSPTGSRNSSRKIKEVSKNFGMPIEQIMELWKLDENDQPRYRPIPMKEMARILTAEHFQLTQHRVSNILAS
jgi:hypothetical protein